MNDAVEVRVVERLRRLSNDFDGERRRERPLSRESVVERLAREELHDEVRRSIVEIAEVERANDVRARDLRGDRCLATEALAQLGALLEKAGVDELHRDARAERDVLGNPNAAHAAFAEQVLEPDATGEDLAGGECRHGRGDVRRLSPTRATGVEGFLQFAGTDDTRKPHMASTAGFEAAMKWSPPVTRQSATGALQPEKRRSIVSAPGKLA